MMAKNYKPVLTIDTHDSEEFERECQQLYKEGYKLIGANVGFVNSEKYDFCASYMAIFAHPLALPGN